MFSLHRIIAVIRSHPRLSIAILLYSAGLIHWFAFIALGHPTYQALDWPLIHQWLDVIKQALLTGRVPYHASYFLNEFQTHQFIWGDRFFAIPYITVSPQVLLLGLLSVHAFMKVQLILLYTLGFLGVYQWVKRLDLSSGAAILLFLFFNFNGFLVGRMGVGHLQNAGYFLVPWFLLLLYRCLEDKHESYSRSIAHGIEFAFLVVFVLMQGSLHTVYQMVLVGFITMLFYPKKLLWYGGSLLLALIGATYFIVPNILYGQYPHAVDRIIFGGYGLASGDAGAPLIAAKNIITMMVNGIYHIWQALTVAYSARFDATWEYSVYISIVGALVLFGSLMTVIAKKRSLIQGVVHRDRFVLAAIVVMGLSFSSVSYHLFNALRHVVLLPSIDRLPSRLFYYPLSVAFLVASTGFDVFVSMVDGKKTKRAIEWIVLFSMFALLMIHSYGWSVNQTEKNYVRSPEALTQKFYTVIYDRLDDTSYKKTVAVSYGVSLATVLVCLGLYGHLRRRDPTRQEKSSTTPSSQDLVRSAREIFSRHRHLSFREKITSIYRPLYAPFDRIIPWIPHGSRVLDIGCSAGTFLFLAQTVQGLGPSQGIDIDTQSIQRAKDVNTFNHITFHTSITISDDLIRQAHVITMVDLLHHIPQAERTQLLTRILRLASSGCTIIIKDLNPTPRWRAMANRITDYLSTRSRVSYMPSSSIVELFRQQAIEVRCCENMYRHVWSHYLIVGIKKVS